MLGIASLSPTYAQPAVELRDVVNFVLELLGACLEDHACILFAVS